MDENGKVGIVIMDENGKSGIVIMDENGKSEKLTEHVIRQINNILGLEKKK